MLIREEREGDFAAIRLVLAAAFRDHPYSDQREHFLVDAFAAIVTRKNATLFMPDVP
jgi:predicted N-acetyltransferase YhbS